MISGILYRTAEKLNSWINGPRCSVGLFLEPRVAGEIDKRRRDSSGSRITPTENAADVYIPHRHSVQAALEELAS